MQSTDSQTTRRMFFQAFPAVAVLPSLAVAATIATPALRAEALGLIHANRDTDAALSQAIHTRDDDQIREALAKRNEQSERLARLVRKLHADAPTGEPISLRVDNWLVCLGGDPVASFEVLDLGHVMTL